GGGRGGPKTERERPVLPPPPPPPPPPQPASTKAPRASTATERARRQRLTAPAEARAHGRDDMVKLPGDARLLPEGPGRSLYRTSIYHSVAGYCPLPPQAVVAGTFNILGRCRAPPREDGAQPHPL